MTPLVQKLSSLLHLLKKNLKSGVIYLTRCFSRNDDITFDDKVTRFSVYLLGMPETNFKGRSTLKDRNVRKSILSSAEPCMFVSILRNNNYETTQIHLF